MIFDKNQLFDSVSRYFMFAQHIVFRIVGLLPWTMDQSFNVFINHKSDKLCRFSFIGSGYSFFLSSVIIILSVYNLIESPSVQIQADPMLTATVTTKLEFITQLGVLLIPIIFICRQTLMTSVINRLEDVNERLKRCPGYAIESNLTAVIVFVVHLVLISGVGTLVGQYHLPLMVLIRCSPGIIASWSVTQFSTLLILITKRIKSINTALLKLGGYIRNNQAQSRSFSILCELMVHEIKNLKNGYVELFEICEDIKDFYGLSILIVIIYYGLQGILVSYFAISSMIQGQSHTTTMHLLNGMRLLLTAFVFTVLTSSVTSTVREVQ